MSAEIMISPGRTRLADWRAVYRGAPIVLDPIARPDVEAGAAALQAIRGGQEPPDGNGGMPPPAAEPQERHGEQMPDGILRLFAALKLASLAQGMSGLRWKTITDFAAFLARDVVPVLPGGEVSDPAALAYLSNALTGSAETRSHGEIDAPSPLQLAPAEHSALLSGAQFTTAEALAGLFEAERIFRSAIVATALTAGATGNADAALHSSAHRLYRQLGQMEVADAFRQLLDLGPRNTTDLTTDERQKARHAIRASLLRLGVCLDLLRQAGRMLENAGNAVTEDRLVIWQDEEEVAGINDTTAMAFAADLIAMALRTMGDLSKQRTAIIAAVASGANGAAGAESAPSQIVAPSNHPAAGPRRLLSMAGTVALAIAVEAVQAVRADQPEPRVLPEVQRLVGEAAPRSGENATVTASDLAAAAELVRTGAFAAAGGVPLPSVVSAGKG